MPTGGACRSVAPLRSAYSRIDIQALNSSPWRGRWRGEAVTEGEVSDVFRGVSSPSVMPSACHLPLAGEELG